MGDRIERAAAAYAAGQAARGVELVNEAYFAVFEDSGMETAVRRYASARRAKELERMFGGIRHAMSAGADPAEIAPRIRALRDALTADAGELEREGVTRESLRGEPEASPGAPPDGIPAPVSAGATAQLLTRLDEAAARYRAGGHSEALALVDRAYFDHFEGQGLEAALGASTPGRKTAVEARFVRIRGLMSAGGPPATVARELEALRDDVREAVALVSASRGPWQAVLAGAVILVREGFEAILILTALVAYLRKAGRRDRVRTVYRAAGAGVVASLLTALALRSLSHLAARHQEVIEGGSMLAAAAVLVYVSYWLTSRTEARRWQGYLRSKVEVALDSGRVAALWAAAFLAVYREGAETVLFYQALLSSMPGQASAIVGGLGLGALVLALLSLLLHSGARRIPMHAFFTWTSVLLYAMAIVFVGRGVRALQAGAALGASPTPWQFTLDWLGVYPTWEGLSVQLLLLVGAAVALGAASVRKEMGDARSNTSPV